MKHGMVDVLVTSAGGIEEDLIKAGLIFFFFYIQNIYLQESILSSVCTNQALAGAGDDDSCLFLWKQHK